MFNPKLQLDLVVDDKGNLVIQNFSNKLQKSMHQNTQAVTNLHGSFSGLGVAITSLAGMAGVGMLARSFFDVAVQADSMNRSMKAALGSAQAAGEAQAYLRQESDRLGLVFKDQISNFMQFAAAAKGTALEGQQVKEVFSAVAEATTVMGLGADDANGVMRALTQMLSKSKIQAEELRGQLGERLPGAFQLAAKAMGMTTEELNKALETGKVYSEDFLPKFAKALRENFAGSVEDAAGSLQAQLNRMKTSWYDFQRTISEAGLIEGIGTAIQAMNDKFKQFMSENKNDLKLFVGDLRDLVAVITSIENPTNDATIALKYFLDHAKAFQLPEFHGALQDIEKIKGAFNTSELEDIQKKITILQNRISNVSRHVDSPIIIDGLNDQLTALKNQEAGLLAVAKASETAVDALQKVYEVGAVSDPTSEWHGRDPVVAAKEYHQSTILDNALNEAFDISSESAAIAQKVEDQHVKSAEKNKQQLEKFLQEAQQKWVDYNDAEYQKRLDTFNQKQGLYDADLGIMQARQQLELDGEEEKNAAVLKDLENFFGDVDDLYQKQEALRKKEQKQAQEEAQRQYEQFLNQIQSATSDVFYDIFSGNLRSFEQFTDRMKDYFFRMLAAMTAKAVAEPIIMPIVQVIKAATGSAVSSIASSAGLGLVKDAAGNAIGSMAGSALGGTALAGAMGVAAPYLGAAAVGGALGYGANYLMSELFGYGKGENAQIGALAGGVLGGPIGGLLGGWIGHTLDSDTEYHSLGKNDGGYTEGYGLTMGKMSTGNSEYDKYLKDKLGAAQAKINSNINTMLAAMDEIQRAQMVEYLKSMDIQYGGSGADWTASTNGTGWEEIGNIRERIQRSMWTGYRGAIGQAGTLSDMGMMDGMESVLAGTDLMNQYSALKDVNLGEKGYTAQFNAFFQDMAQFRQVWDQMSGIFDDTTDNADALLEALEAVSSQFDEYKATLVDLGVNAEALIQLEAKRAESLEEVLDAVSKSYIDAWESFADSVLFSDLAPVQSSEMYQNQYYDLLDQAKTGDYAAYTELLDFVKNDYLPFAQDYGGNYTDTWDRLFGESGELSNLSVDLGNIGADISEQLITALGPYLEAMDGDLHIVVQIGSNTLGSAMVEEIRSNPDVVAAIQGV